MQIMHNTFQTETFLLTPTAWPVAAHSRGYYAYVLSLLPGYRWGEVDLRKGLSNFRKLFRRTISTGNWVFMCARFIWKWADESFWKPPRFPCLPLLLSYCGMYLWSTLHAMQKRIERFSGDARKQGFHVCFYCNYHIHLFPTIMSRRFPP